MVIVKGGGAGPWLPVTVGEGGQGKLRPIKRQQQLVQTMRVHFRLCAYLHDK